MRCSGVGGARYGFMFFSEIAEIFFCCGGGKGLNQKQTCDLLAGGVDGRKIAQIFFNGFLDHDHQWNQYDFRLDAVLFS